MASVAAHFDTRTGLPTYPADKPPCVHGEWCYLALAGLTGHYAKFGHPASHPNAVLPAGVEPTRQRVYPSPQPASFYPPESSRVRSVIQAAKKFELIDMDPGVPDEKAVIDWIQQKVVDSTGMDFQPDEFEGVWQAKRRFRKVNRVTAIINQDLADQFEQTRKQVRARGLDDSVEWGWHTTSRGAMENIARANFISPDNPGDSTIKRLDPGYYGLGVYFAMAFDYTARYNSPNKEGLYPVMLAQVVRGRCWFAKVRTRGVRLPTGYDSIMAPGGAELSIRSPGFILPSYIIDVEYHASETPH